MQFKTNDQLFAIVQGGDRDQAALATREIRRRVRTGRIARSQMRRNYSGLYEYYDEGGLDIWEMYFIVSLFEEIAYYDDFEDFGIGYETPAVWEQWEGNFPEQLQGFEDLQETGGGVMSDGEADAAWAALDEAVEASSEDASTGSDEEALDAIAEESGSEDPTASGDGS